MGKKNTRKKGPSKIEQDGIDLQKQGWKFERITKKGTKIVLGFQATKNMFTVENTTLARVIEEINNTDFDKLLKEHNLKQVKPQPAKVYVDGEYIGDVDDVTMDGKPV